MRKVFILIITILTLFLLAACEDEMPPEPTPLPPFHELTFNIPESVSDLLVQTRLAPFTHPLTDAQLSAVFPHLDLPWKETRAFYLEDGTLLGVSAEMPHFYDAEAWSWNIIQIEVVGVEDVPFFADSVVFANDFVPQTSDVHGVSVAALMIPPPPTREDWIAAQWMRFRADFMMDHVEYRIWFNDYKESGKARLTDIVNRLILGGTDGLATLEDPEVPELRSEYLSLEEALLEPDFAPYLPTNIPDDFTHISSQIRINQNNNWLRTRWESDRPRSRYIQWDIDKLSEEERAKFADVHASGRHERAGFTYEILTPMFFPDELTIEALEAIAEGGMGSIIFFVIFDDIRILVSNRGMTTEETLALFADLIPSQ